MRQFPEWVSVGCACRKCATLHGTISRADDFSRL